MDIRKPKTERDFELYYDLRWRILRKPWDQPKGSEKDELEDESIHVMVCEQDGIPLGIGRAHLNSPEEAQFRYMAVEENQRRKGIGALVLNELEKKVKEQGAKCVVLNAREKAVGFYKRFGYEVVGEAHMLFGSIPHSKMRKEL